MKKYTLIVSGIYDNDPIFKYVTADEMREIIKMGNLMKWDYAIVDGIILKTFDNGSFDIKNLK